MNTSEILVRIKSAIDSAPRNSYIAELHLQIIKYADELEALTGKEFCEGLGIGPSFGTEFAKMRKIAGRLKQANLNVNLI
jgi:hypothetical protein